MHPRGFTLAHRDKGVDIQDQGHAAITQDRRSGDPWDLLIVGLQRLDHDLPLAMNTVGDERRAASDLAIHEQHDTLGGIDLSGLKPKHPSDVDQGHIGVTHGQNAALDTELLYH